MDPLTLVRLHGLMALTSGRPDLIIGLLDGPLARDHPDLAQTSIRWLPGVRWSGADQAAREHGSFIAGILAARREGVAPAIAPDCTLLVRPVLSSAGLPGPQPSASTGDVAEAIVQCVNAGARLLNLSAALVASNVGAHAGNLELALHYAARSGVLVVAAAGNRGLVCGSAVTRHSAVIPVVACTGTGRPLAQSDLGRSIGLTGIGGPGEDVTSLSVGGGIARSAGSSVATPFVTGAAALLWSLFPWATIGQLRFALLYPPAGHRRSIVPPLLDASRAYHVLLKLAEGGQVYVRARSTDTGSIASASPVPSDHSGVQLGDRGRTWRSDQASDVDGGYPSLRPVRTAGNQSQSLASPHWSSMRAASIQEAQNG